MQIIERIQLKFASEATKLKRLRQAGLIIMRHVGIEGRCECLKTVNTEGQTGILMQISTMQIIPPINRVEFHKYFKRKLLEFGELGQTEFILKIIDADDTKALSRLKSDVSSIRVASVIVAANPTHDWESVQNSSLKAMQQKIQEQRLKRTENSEEVQGYISISPRARLTDLSPLTDS